MTEPASVVTRFAPSPTGFLHIGGVRTALFNWLFARHHGGRYLLRIEDTDRKRSTDEAIEAILDGLAWMGLEGDDPPLFQSRQASRHAECAHALLREGKAYACYASQEELAAMRDAARAQGLSARYDGRWRDRDPSEAPADIAPVIRFKAPREGETVIEDRIQGTVRVANSELDDMILLRADGTPTYMLSVVVDDHDMGVTHVIRGDDHLTNSFRQSQLMTALGWPQPIYGHMPLLHGDDGAKLSKRHGALGIEAYRDMGILPEAMFNYLLRLGWSHGNDEIISRAQAIEWFTLDAVGRSPARFDMSRLRSLNAHYLRNTDDDRLMTLLAPHLPADADAAARARFRRGLAGLKTRAETLIDLAGNGAIYLDKRPLVMEDKAARLLDPDARQHLARLLIDLEALEIWSEATLDSCIRRFIETRGMKLGAIAQPLRAAVTGRTQSPGLFEVLDALGREETLARLKDVLEPDASVN